jgi:hypothetical protein
MLGPHVLSKQSGLPFLAIMEANKQVLSIMEYGLMTTYEYLVVIRKDNKASAKVNKLRVSISINENNRWTHEFTQTVENALLRCNLIQKIKN